MKHVLTQGEQARSLGPFLLGHGFSVDFAHRTFAWSSEARGKANVHVVIVGFSRGGQPRQRRLFEYLDVKGAPVEKKVSNINFYLADAPDVTIAKHTVPFIPLPLLTKGSQPTDDGNLIVEPEDYDEVMKDPIAAKYVRRLIGAKDMLNNTQRWCLWLVDADPDDLHRSPVLRRRLAAVATWRKTVSKTASVRAQADSPGLFTQIRQPRHRYLCIPRHSSENRRIVPMSFFAPDDIAHDSILTLDAPPLWLFGVLQSAMFNAWVRNVCGRLESRIRIEPDLAYNAFPFIPELPQHADRIEPAAQGVLDARSQFSTSSLAALYDSLATPRALSKAHDALDAAVDARSPPGVASPARLIVFPFFSCAISTSLRRCSLPLRKSARQDARYLNELRVPAPSRGCVGRTSRISDNSCGSGALPAVPFSLPAYSLPF